MGLMKVRRGMLSSSVAANALYPLTKSGALTTANLVTDSRKVTTGALTVANLITDDLRELGVQGDGVTPPDSSVGVWPAATNLVANGGATTGTTGWVSYPTGTVARTTSEYYFGAAGFQFTPAALNDIALYTVNVSPSTTYTAQIRFKTPDSSILFLVDEFTAGSAYVTGHYSGLTPTPNEWMHATITFTSDATTAKVNIGLSASASTNVFYFDGVQLEAGSVATPYIETDGGTASRSAGRISASPTGIITATQGWVIARIKTGFAATGPGYVPRLFSYGDATDDHVAVNYTSGTGWVIENNATGGGAAQSKAVTDSGLAVGDSRTVLAGWTSAEINVSIGSAWSSATSRTEIPTVSASVFDIGSMSGYLSAREIASNILWVAMGSGPYTALDPVAIAALGNTDPSPSDFPASAQLTFLAGFDDDGTAYTTYSTNVRELGVQGDGAAYPDSSVGVWPAATNLVTNGGFETNTTGWAKNGTGEESLDRVTTTSKFGSACLKVTLGGAVTYDGPRFMSVAMTNGTVYTAGAWVKCETGTLALRIQILDALSAILATTTFTATTSWQRVSVTFTANANTPFSPRIINNTSGVSTAVYYVDGVSCYASAIDMPYIETDGSTASRSQGTIQGPASVLDETQGWVWVRGKTGFGNSAEPSADPTFFSIADDASNNLRFIYVRSTNTIHGRRTQGGTSAGNPSAGLALTLDDNYSAGYYWNSTTLGVSPNGNAWTTAGNTNIPTLSATTFYIGEDIAFAGRPLCGAVRWFAAGKGVLSNADAALLHSFGNNDPLPHQFPTSAQLTFLARFNGDGTIYRYV